MTHKICIALGIILITIFSEIKSNNQKQDNSGISDTLYYLSLLKQYESALHNDSSFNINLIKELFEKSTQNGFMGGIAKAGVLLGEYYLEKYDLSNAEYFLTQSLDAFKRQNNKMNEANIMNSLGVIAEKKGHYDEAVGNYLYAFEIYDSLNYFQGISATTNNIGIIYYLMDLPEKALGFFELSLNFKAKLGDSAAMLYTFQNIGDVHFELWNYDSAKYYFNRCIQYAGQLDQPKSKGKALNSLGFIHLISGNIKEAEDSFNQALKFSQKEDDYQNIASIYENIGLLYRNSGNNSMAISYFDSSLHVALIHELNEETRNAYMQLAEAYAASNNYLEAFNNMQLYDEINSRLQIKKSRVSGIEALYIKQKQENKILRLEKEKEQKKNRIILLWGIILILLILAFFSFILYKNRQKVKLERAIAEQEKIRLKEKAKQEQLRIREIAALEKNRFQSVIEAQEIERKRIASELHDNIGPLLSISKMNLSVISKEIQGKITKSAEILTETISNINETCEEVRNLSHILMPGVLIRLGLSNAIKELIRKMNVAGKIKFEFLDNLGDKRFEESVEISLYRIIQELFNNIVKHSKASEVNITLGKDQEHLVLLIIRDNGKGFDTNSIKSSKGIGWKNIYSRLSMINGDMKIQSDPGEGTKVELAVAGKINTNIS